LAKAIKILPADSASVPWNPDILLHDVTRSLPFASDSADAVYASHLLEHLHLEEGKSLMKECFRVLKSGGVLRMVVPNLRADLMEYLGNDTSGEQAVTASFRADLLMAKLNFYGREARPRSLLHRIFLAMGDHTKHKWMYDPESLVGYFQWAGFVEVREMAFRISRIHGIGDVELPERVLNGAGICVEGSKPRSPVHS